MHGLIRTLITGNRVAMQACGLYKHRSAVLQSHHICPESWWKKAGKPVETPFIECCPTCHMNIHAAIDGILYGYDTSDIPRGARRLAQQAFDIAEKNGLTPARTL